VEACLRQYKKCCSANKGERKKSVRNNPPDTKVKKEKEEVFQALEQRLPCSP